MRTASTTLILLFLALGFFAGTSHCHKAALPIAGLTKVCTFNGELKKAAARSANLIGIYVSKLSQLQTLEHNISLLVMEGVVNATDEIALIQAAGRKGTEDMINTLHNDMPKAIYAAATCSLFAGRVDDFVGVFAGAKGSANYCVKDGDGAYNHAQENKLQGCLEGDGSFQGISETAQQNPPQIGTSYNALQADTAGRTANGEHLRPNTARHKRRRKLRRERAKPKRGLGKRVIQSSQRRRSSGCNRLANTRAANNNGLEVCGLPNKDAGGGEHPLSVVKPTNQAVGTHEQAT
uniref:Variant surface glycoprotein 1796 n=1 Tax=Trypanosoma brucei TaxID=5691 RepID=M4TCH2_9TRYP|nr:variant surface glycoprotein 1796 [Trypanosoma brucei]